MTQKNTWAGVVTKNNVDDIFRILIRVLENKSYAIKRKTSGSPSTRSSSAGLRYINLCIQNKIRYIEIWIEDDLGKTTLLKVPRLNRKNPRFPFLSVSPSLISIQRQNNRGEIETTAISIQDNYHTSPIKLEKSGFTPDETWRQNV